MKMRHPELLLKPGSQGKGLKSLLEPIGKFRDVLCSGSAFSYSSLRKSTKTGSPLSRILKAMRVQPAGQEGCTV